MMFCYTILGSSHAASVLCDVAADERILVTRRVRSKHQTVPGNRLLHIKRSYPRLTNRVKIIDIDVNHTVHTVSPDDNPAVNRNCSACVPDTSAASGNRKQILI